MLPQQQRLRNPDQFRAAIRRGVRVGRQTLVMHVLPSSELESRAGFVVSKAVGGAVVRNRVKRRLRHLMRGPLSGTPHSVDVVVRALPASTSGNLRGDFESAWAVAWSRLEQR